MYLQWQLFRSLEYHDIVLVSKENDKFPCHKGILAARSGISIVATSIKIIKLRIIPICMLSFLNQFLLHIFYLVRHICTNTHKARVVILRFQLITLLYR